MALRYVRQPYVQNDGTIVYDCEVDTHAEIPGSLPVGARCFCREHNIDHVRGTAAYLDGAGSGGGSHAHSTHTGIGAGDHHVAFVQADHDALANPHHSSANDHANTEVAHSWHAAHASWITASGVTYENLSANADIGTAATQVSQGDHTHAGGGGLGYTLPFQALTSGPADGATIYMGMQPRAPVTTAGQQKIRIPKAGTIKYAYIYSRAGTAGTGENWSAYVRLNNTTDTLIQTLGVTTNERIWENSGLSVAVVAGDYIEIKFVNPTWVTNPLTWVPGGFVYIE